MWSAGISVVRRAGALLPGAAAGKMRSVPIYTTALHKPVESLQLVRPIRFKLCPPAKPTSLTSMCYSSGIPSGSGRVTGLSKSCAASKLLSFRTAPRRLLCTGQAPQEGVFAAARSAVAWAAENRTAVLVVAGAAVVMYGFYRFSYRVMSFLINVPPHKIFTAGFALGILVALTAFGGFHFWRRYVSTHVDDVYAVALKELRKHDQVAKALGGLWRPGRFKGYVIEPYEEALRGSERRARSSYFEFPAQRVQMVFQVNGLEHTGLVSLQAFKRRGEYHFEMLAMDVLAEGALPEDERHIRLSGDKDHPLFPEVLDILSAAKAKKAHGG
uniref:Mitochondrial import inner membrane translocase subunit Tim21 n=1 Tax=Chrysotila carterae TaxID=13221 RepID=A0A7S4BDM3_CHRCT